MGRGILHGKRRGGIRARGSSSARISPRGDAASNFPAQAAAGFLAQVDGLPDLTQPPFCFPERYENARKLIEKSVRLFTTTSVGRLFDAAAALLGFTRAVTFEGQAAIWLEQLARGITAADPYPFPFTDSELDFRPLLQSVVRDRLRGRHPAQIARAFQRAIAQGLCDAALALSPMYSVDTVALSGGVFQNELLLEDVQSILQPVDLNICTNHSVPANDGGISLGQAALAAFGQFNLIS